MGIPEPLVTIRQYASSELAEEDCRVLREAGVNAYGGNERPARGISWIQRGAVRVPESQVEKALAILPPPLPDLMAPLQPPKVCPWCGSGRARYSAPAARFAALVGVFAAVLLAGYRHFQAAALVFAFTVWAMYLSNISSGVVCANCGREWRALPAAPEPEHEPGTENPEE